MKENFQNDSPSQHTPKFNSESHNLNEKDARKDIQQLEKLRQNQNNYFQLKNSKMKEKAYTHRQKRTVQSPISLIKSNNINRHDKNCNSIHKQRNSRLYDNETKQHQRFICQVKNSNKKEISFNENEKLQKYMKNDQNVFDGDSQLEKSFSLVQQTEATTNIDNKSIHKQEFYSVSFKSDNSQILPQQETMKVEIQQQLLDQWSKIKVEKEKSIDLIEKRIQELQDQLILLQDQAADKINTKKCYKETFHIKSSFYKHNQSKPPQKSEGMYSKRSKQEWMVDMKVQIQDSKIDQIKKNLKIIDYLIQQQQKIIIENGGELQQKSFSQQSTQNSNFYQISKVY